MGTQMSAKRVVGRTGPQTGAQSDPAGDGMSPIGVMEFSRRRDRGCL
jgi:hypothetical protein